MTILDRSSGVINTASTTWTVTRSSGTWGTGTVLVAILFGNTTFPTPSGWTPRPSSVSTMGLYSFDRVAAGETSFVLTNNAAGTGEWYVYELSAGSTYDIGLAAQATATQTNHTTPAITPTAGNRHLIAVAGGNAGSRSVTGWSGGFVGWGGGGSTGGDLTFSQAADLNSTTDGVTAVSSTATFNSTVADRGGMTLSYINNAGDTTPPSIPTGLVTTNIGSTTADLSWTASTDNVAVTGYELQIIGP